MTLIPRTLLFGNPERASVQLSPDGTRLAWLAPVDGVLNVWVAPRGELSAAKAVTNDTVRGIRMYAWTFASNYLLYLQDKGGDENWRLYRVDLNSGATTDLTPFEGIRAQVQQLSPGRPDELLVGLNRRDPQYHDLYRVNIQTAELELVFENTRFAGILTDQSFALRQAYAIRPDGGVDVFSPAGDGKAESWEKTDDIPHDDTMTTDAVGFDASGTILYETDSRNRNTAALFATDTSTGKRTLIAEDTRADLADLIRHPETRRVQAAAFTYERKEWQIVDEALAKHLAALDGLARGELEIVSRTLDDSRWIVAYAPDNGPVSYYEYETGTGKAEFLFTNRPALEGQPLVPMHSKTIKTRDGLDMVIYYSLPDGSDPDGDGIPNTPLPFVLFPHGGPWARDEWGYSPTHQWLANRGYAVMGVNFRSSTGFGKAFTNAGDREWGGKIMEDQIDAVNWAKDQGIADADKVAIMGGSFGGYSTLAGITMFPDVFACGVDIVGPSNLITLLESVPEYWKPMLDMMLSRVGDFRTEEGKALLKKHSPLTYVDQIRSPLLIGQGANDPRVKQAESDQIVKAMQEKNIPVTYVLYPDEGHGFARPENRFSFFAVAEAFFSRHLGGEMEPVGEAFEGSSIEIPSGRDEVPGLPA
jgi:dipeptidyl aminopeptidase/acylaminoacyl peptidase